MGKFLGMFLIALGAGIMFIPEEKKKPAETPAPKPGELKDAITKTVPAPIIPPPPLVQDAPPNPVTGEKK